jgi:DNA polymerase IV
MPSRKIIHVDMDCFFVAVEIRDNPNLAGQAVAVGGSPQKRGVIATANYEARQFNVHSALASSLAVKRCPELIIIPPTMSKYKEVSNQVFEIFQRFTPLIQPISLDEAFLDVSDCSEFKGSATLIAQAIKETIKRETGLTASAGVAPNKFLAKIASDWMKPDGIYVIPPNMIDSFILNLPIEKIWGVGKVTAKKMHQFGIKNCADIQKLTLTELVQCFGNRAEELADLARGIDNRPVQVDRIRKSFSREKTFSSDLNHEDAFVMLSTIFYDAQGKLKIYLLANPDYTIKTAIVKLKFSDFSSTTVECSATHFDLNITQELMQKALLRSELEVRLIGCGVKFSHYIQTSQAELFP